MIFDLTVISLLLILSFMLIYRDFKLALYVLLIVSILLHKQLFSIYRWDIMPVRLFMVAFMVFIAYRVFRWYRGGGTVSQAVEFLKQPFVLFLVLLWVIRGISIIFTQNLPASLSLYAFFTTVVVMGLFLYQKFSDKPTDLLKYLKTYIVLTFLLSLFAIFQFYTHLTYGWVFGALWAVPDNLPRVGASFWDVNHFGGLLAGILPVIAVFIIISKKLSHRFFYIAAFLPVVLALLMTNSRTSWISAAVSFTLLTMILFIRWFRSRGFLAVIVALILVSTPFLIEYNREGSPFRQYVKDYFHYRIDSFDAHFMLLEGSGEIFDRYPYLGGGYGSFFEHFSETKIATEFFERDPAAFSVRVPAHTIWGELAAETGIAGLLIFSLFVLAGLVPLLYLAFTSKNKEQYFLGAAMSAAVVGWLTAGIFYSYNAEYFWLIFFFYFIYGIGMVGKDKLSAAFTYFIKSEKLAVSLLAGLAFVLIFLNLGKNHFLPWDEAIYSKISKNMVISGEYVVQSWLPEKIWYEKPPLSMWLMAGSMKLLGFTEYAARLPSAILGLLTIMVVYFFGRRLFNRTTGFIAAFVLLTTFNYLYYARAAMLDVSVTFFITLSLYLWWVNKENNNPIALILGGLAAGGAVMTKGVIGFVPFVVIFLYEAYLFLTRQHKQPKQALLAFIKRSAVFFFFSAAVFLPWHLEMYRRFGQAFLDNYIGYHVLDRATTAIEDKAAPFWWYVIVMKVSMRIWFIALIPALVVTVLKILKKSNKHVFIAIWFTFIFLLFSFSQSKLKWYIIPVYPAAALLVGYFIERALTLFIDIVFRNRKALVKGLMVFLLVFVGISYLFLNKELVYEPDLTGAQAQLLEDKDKLYGTEVPVYVDLIERPLTLYYTDGPYVEITFRRLNNLMSDMEPGESVVFITKESRFFELKEAYPLTVPAAQYKEWMLGYYRIPIPELEEIIPVQK